MTTLTTEHVPCGDAVSMTLSVWTPQVHPIGSVLLIQEIFGVGAYSYAVAQRLANAGFLVGAPDVFWRFAPAGQPTTTRPASWRPWNRSASSIPRSRWRTASLRSNTSVASPPRRGCRSSRRSSATASAARSPGVAAHGQPSCCVSYYGSGVPGMLGLVQHVGCPTLFHFGNQDPYIPNDGVEAIAAAIAGSTASSSTSRTPATPSTTTRARCSGTRTRRRPPGRRRWPSSTHTPRAEAPGAGQAIGKSTTSPGAAAASVRIQRSTGDGTSPSACSRSTSRACRARSRHPRGRDRRPAHTLR